MFHVGQVFLVCIIVANARAQMMQTCAGMNMLQMRAILEHAIENARASLERQKQLNEYLGSTGKWYDIIY